MKREIKYRQPLFNEHREFKEWHYWGVIDGSWVGPLTRKYVVYTKLCDPADSQQYTGLKDKNGVDVYEGDVLDFGYGKYAVGWYSEVGCWALCRPIGSVASYPIIHTDTSRVIGNIYENPDLIK